MEYSKDQIPFLDILIKRNNTGIWMDLYHEPTVTKGCLPFTSSHPNHCKQNILFCLAQRICFIAENNTKKNLSALFSVIVQILRPSSILKNFENLETFENLSKYHYQDSLIKQRFQKTLSIPQKDLQKPKNTIK